MTDRQPSADATEFVWPYPVAIPQRYRNHQARYLERGGLVDVIDDAKAFAADGPLGDTERFVFFCLALDQIQKEGIGGNIAELGVYKGQTASVLARMARRLGRTAYLLDTFEGFDQRDFSGPDDGRGPQFDDTSLSAVRARVGDANTTYIKGYFPETAKHLDPDETYCLVHIDCDLYAPILSGLEYFYPRMAPGGFLIVHDYTSLQWEGTERAVDLFFADKPEAVIPLPDSAGSAVIRKMRSPQQGPTWLERKQTLALDIWHHATRGGLSNLLGPGWSRHEPWGVWGVGQSHELVCCPADPSLREFEIDFEVHAALLDARPSQRVEVRIDGEHATTWEFTSDANRSVKTIAVSRPESRGNKSVTVEFRPSSVARIHDLDPTKSDTRALGLALHGIRLRRASGTAV